MPSAASPQLECILGILSRGSTCAHLLHDRQHCAARDALRSRTLAPHPVDLVGVVLQLDVSLDTPS